MLILCTFFSSLIICGILIYFKDRHLHLSGDHGLSGPQKFHRTVVPRIGGLGIFLAFGIGIIIFINLKNQNIEYGFYIFLASLPAFFIGLIEDITKRVGQMYRFISAFFSGLIFCWLFEIETIRLGISYFDFLFQSQFLTIIFLSFAITGLVNAYNIIDGFNGLASMVGILGLAAILYVGIQVNDRLLVDLSLMAIGAISGFFLWNYPRGLIFLGDSGAYWIGFLTASLSILLVVRHEIVSPWFALMVNAYPIIETIFTIWRRSVDMKKNVGDPDRSHLHSHIYLYLIKNENEFKDKKNDYFHNARTSPFLWMLSCLGSLPAIIWWDSTTNLKMAAVCFLIFYIFLYFRFLKFSKLT